jgi:ABC-type Mn2+/Zn2+ transport system permease subunit
MLFWIIAVLSVVGVLATVWGLYLLARRWLLFSSEPLGESLLRAAPIGRGHLEFESPSSGIMASCARTNGGPADGT